MNGEHAYLLISYHLTGNLWHVSSGINNHPLNCPNIWIAYHTTPNVQKKYVVM